MKKFSLFTAVALSMGIAFAQAEPGTPTDVPQAADISEGCVVDEDSDITELLQSYLEKKGWTEGDNVKKNGEGFIVVTGVGPISASSSKKNYNLARNNAATMALLDAKSNLAEYLESVIETATELKVTGGTGEESASPEAQLAQVLANQPDDSICGKCITLIHKKLDNALKAEGYDVDGERQMSQREIEEAKAKIASIMEHESFKNTINRSAKSLISGLQVFYSIEAKGNIGIVAIWSPALAEMASSIVTGQPVADKSPKVPIIKQIPTDKATLLATFGVQQKINEHGELVLVSYGQYQALSTSKRGELEAYKNAKAYADQNIRSFAGEAVVTTRDLEDAQESLVYSDESGLSPDYSNTSAYESFQKAASKALPINGIGVIKKWNAVHPVSGKKVYGVISSWSPKGAVTARAYKKKIETEAKDGAMGIRKIRSSSTSTATKRVTPSISEDEYINSGAEGDEDAF